MADILEKIARYKAQEVAALKQTRSYADLEQLVSVQIEPRGFAYALSQTAKIKPALIAEIKKASPSKGLIREDFRPADFARDYQNGGAACLSVLTDAPSFQGQLGFMVAAKQNCNLPILRKDFMVDPYQIIEARAHGADAILIIMAMIDDQLAAELFKLSTELGMDSLVETHDENEMKRAIDLGATLIGVNNRNLKTFDTSLKTFERLSPLAPKGSQLIAESGIFTHQDILYLTQMGANGFLVGESLMRQPDIESATRTLLGQSL